MEIGEKVIVQILGSDILDSNYMNINDCALAKATKRHFNTDDVYAGSRTLNVGKKDFKINSNQFNNNVFKALKEITTKNKANEIVVEVELTYYKDLDY